MKEDINWLKTENKNQKEEIHLLKKQSKNQEEEIHLLNNQKKDQEKEILQMKSSIEHLQNLQDKAYFTNQTMSNVSFGISNKRTARAVTSEPVEKQTNPADLSSTSWAKLEISNRVIGEMNYNTYTVKIYGHSSNKDVNLPNQKKKYYFEPIGQLNHKSAKSTFNNVSKKYEMTFDVNMWDDTIRDAVHKFISDDLDLGPVNKHLVGVLPLDNVMIMYKSTGKPTSDFAIEQDSINYKSNKHLTFKFICDRHITCYSLATQMNLNPEQFQFKMRFSVSSENSQTKQTKISVKSIMHGDMMNTLDQKYKGKEAILTAEAKNKLTKESSENVIIQTIDDTQVPSQTSKNEIYRIIEKMLEFSRTTIEKGDEKAWERVFWNDDNYRPDQTSKTLNDLYTKLDEKSQNKLASEFKNTNKVEYGGGLTAWGITANSKFEADFSREGKYSQANLEKLLYEAKDRVEWDGSKFVPKQMELYSMNMTTLRDKKAFTDTNLWVSYRTSMLTIDVQYDLSLDPGTSSATQILSKLFNNYFLTYYH